MSQGGPSDVDLERGALLAERYQIEDALGRGGMGAVYRARDLALGETIALKVLARNGDGGALSVLRFRQEVRLARKVTHPNVARVYDIGEHAGVVYLTMEIVEGETLRQRLRREGSLPPAEARRIAIALCDGLHAAHSAGIVHRDLKPANVLLERGGRVVITDFGIARAVTEWSGLTVGAIGTPTYMAPEQLSSGTIDGRADIYALGLVLHEMLTGHKPSESTVRIEHAPDLAELVRRCTAPSPDARPATALEVARAIRDPANDAAEATLARAPSELSAALAVTITQGPPASPEPALAVLPFRYRGPADEDGFGDAITDELVDILARTRGLRVLGAGATLRYRDARDPRVVGADLGATAVIDGTAQISGGRVRITVRLLDAGSGMQIWTERHDGDLGDLIALAETIAHRVAEELRVELTTMSHRGAASAEAMEHYLAGRQRLSAPDFEGASTAIASLDRCLALAPDFAPALAARAIASLRAWYYDMEGDATDWESAAQQSVARAALRAPELAETHLAMGILSTHAGDLRAAARALERALAIAPTYAEAHEYLGMLQCEAGRPDEGLRRLRLAVSLDPTLTFGHAALARHHALHARWDEASAALAELDRLPSPTVARVATAHRVRFAAWRRDREALRRFAAEAPRAEADGWAFVRVCARALAHVDGVDDVRRGIAQILAATQNPRFASFAMQIAAEIHADLGELEEAQRHLVRAAASVLVDIDWLDHCPLLAPLRELPDWADARRRVRARADAVWMK